MIVGVVQTRGLGYERQRIFRLRRSPDGVLVRITVDARQEGDMACHAR